MHCYQKFVEVSKLFMIHVHEFIDVLFVIFVSYYTGVVRSVCWCSDVLQVLGIEGFGCNPVRLLRFFVYLVRFQLSSSE